MRREGFELQIGSPTVIFKKDDKGNKLEPFEEVECTVPEEYVGAVVDILAKRKGTMLDLAASTSAEKVTTIKYLLPTRGALGLRNACLTATRGTAVLDSFFSGYHPFVGDIESRDKGSLLASEGGSSTPFAIVSVQERGLLFIPPKTDVRSRCPPPILTTFVVAVETAQGPQFRPPCHSFVHWRFSVGVHRHDHRDPPAPGRPQGERVQGQGAHQHARGRLGQHGQAHAAHGHVA